MSPAVAVPIRGQITELADDLVAISVGSSSGVRKGMTFIIYRGGEYLGKLVVEMVEPDRAGGRITTRVGQIQVGDYVTEESRFRAGGQ